MALQNNWNASVNDYAISGGWNCDGNSLVVSDASGGIYVFNGKSGEVIWSQKQVHAVGGLSTAMHPFKNKFVTTGQDSRILIWDTYENNIIKEINLGHGWVENVEWSQDGKWLAASCSRTVYIYNETGDEVWRSDDHNSTVSQIAWAANNELATACYGKVTFFDASSGKQTQTLEWKGSLISMVLSPNGDIVACGSQDNSVHFWRRSTGKDSMMSGYPFKPDSLSFDETGTFLATGGNVDVTVWSFQGKGPEGTTPLSLEQHAEPLTSLAFSNRGLNLASGSRDGTVVLWGLRMDNKESDLSETRLTDSVSNLYWHPDDKALAALDGQGVITVWHVT